ncbi:odorant receptor 4-like isoform X2 [Vespa mandarinia]|uniref:odorant receptor 4-like isoform X2 n=1 Tax=Vespa mandarinia TaxID=7446 RepID=UPI001608922B|nr:odorant receptor 4-like isoform X2 [Vespa mandarinia]
MTTKKKDEYEIEVNYLNRVCGKLLQILGISNHSKEPTSFVVRFTKFLSILVCYALIVFFLVTTILHAVLVEQNVHIKVKKMPLLLYNVLLLIKYNCLIMRRKHIERCMKLIEKDLTRVVNLYHRDIILEKTKYGKRLFIAICVFLHITVLFWRLLLPLIKGKVVTAENVTIRPLPSSGYYFHLIDDQVSPFYEIIFFLQCAEGCVTIYTNIVICTLAVIFVVHACSQLEIFIDLLEAVVTCTKSTEKIIEEEDVNAKLTIAVKHHIRVRNFLQMVESTMNPLYFMDIFGCSITQCFLGYCLTIDWDRQNVKNVLPYMISIVSLTVQIFVFCYVGQQLMLQDEKVALKTCVLEWHRIPYKKAKNIIPIIILSNRRMKITAGTIIELSLQTFGQEWTNHNLAIVFMYSIALSSIICNIFILCYIGEQLTLQAEKVARTSCTLDWYNLPSKELSGLVLVIAISNRPMKITAGNIVELSLQTFGNVSNFFITYTYFVVGIDDT